MEATIESRSHQSDAGMGEHTKDDGLQGRGYRDEGDRKAVSDLVNSCCEWVKAACARGDKESLHNISRLLVGIILVEQSLAAFRTTPRAAIRGKHGVAEKLRLTRNGVYARIAALGLEPKDFVDPGASVASLVEKSSVLGPIVRQPDELQPASKEPSRRPK